MSGKDGFSEKRNRVSHNHSRTGSKKIDLELKDVGKFVHISPFTTADFRELPLKILAEAVNTLNFKFVISCAANEREKNKLDHLLQLLQRKPVRVFAGNLNIVELTALISRSGLHLGGDSGALHTALMTNTPSISWFRYYRSNRDWMPEGAIHKQLVGQASHDGIQGISSDDLVQAISKSTLPVLASGRLLSL